MNDDSATHEPIRVFIGYDPREAVAFSVLSHSIHRYSTAPVSIVPLMLSQLGGIYCRSRDPLQSSDFSFSRFLTPYLSGFRGWSMFMDCDMIMREDIQNLWRLRDPTYAVMCVQHDYVPTETRKFLGEHQTKYQKKNWSSVMLFNNERCRTLTPEYVNAATGLELHQFKWLQSDAAIGSLPGRWNHLVGVNDHDPDAALVHYTIGGPYFDEYRECPFSTEWRVEQDAALQCAQKIKR